MIVRCRFLLNGFVNCRNLYRLKNEETATFLIRFSSSERSKVEETLKMLKNDLELQRAEEDARKKKLAVVKEKLPLKTRVMNELKHYYHGFRLLALETRLSARYLWRIARGNSLSRRERQQMIRTVSDLLRLVPFLFFVIVPFMEFALPIFIKIFPGMLPSTFQEASKEEEKLRRQVKVKIEMAKFLQDTLEEIALERRSKAKKDSVSESKAYEFTQFLRKIRTEGGYVSNEDLFKYTKLFEDELTLDSLSMSQLRALCRILSVAPFGPPEILRFQLNMKLRDLKNDDTLIAAEGGIDSLSAQEVQNACRARGMRAVGVNEERLRQQLKQWLELSLSDKVPPSLLLLSRALYIPEEINFTDRLRTILTVLPAELGEQTRQKLTEIEGGVVNPKERLELLRQIEEGLNKEREESKKRKETEDAAKRLEQEKLEAFKEEGAADYKTANEELLKKVQDLVSKPITLLEDDKEASAAAQAANIVQAASETALETTKNVQEIAENDGFESLGDIHETKQNITELKEKIIEHTEDLIAVKELADDYTERKIAQRLRARVNSLVSGMDTLIAKLEAERQNMKEDMNNDSSNNVKTKDNDNKIKKLN